MANVSQGKTSKVASLMYFRETPIKAVSTLLALVAMVGFVFPYVGNLIRTNVAEWSNLNGYVYYEIGVDDRPTEAGQLDVLRRGPKYFENILRGDILRAQSEKVFRQGPSVSEPSIFQLNKDDCVVVLKQIRPKEKSGSGVSGGWLKVATIKCNLF